jgi:hypothetical protein
MQKQGQTTTKVKKCKTCLKVVIFPTVSANCPKCQRAKLKLKKEKQKERSKIKKEAKRNSVQVLTKQADILFSKAIRLRDGKSVKSGSTESLQCSHIWSRSNKAIRWDLDNALTLTAGEHLYWWHKEPAEAIEWAKEVLGKEKWIELQNKRNAYFKLTPGFLQERINFLKEFINQYEPKRN